MNCASDGGKSMDLCPTGQIGYHWKWLSQFVFILGQVVEQIHSFFSNSLCIFHHTEEAISFAAKVVVAFCLLVQLEASGIGAAGLPSYLWSE